MVEKEAVVSILKGQVSGPERTNRTGVKKSSSGALSKNSGLRASVTAIGPGTPNSMFGIYHGGLSNPHQGEPQLLHRSNRQLSARGGGTKLEPQERKKESLKENIPLQERQQQQQHNKAASQQVGGKKSTFFEVSESKLQLVDHLAKKYGAKLTKEQQAQTARTLKEETRLAGVARLSSGLLLNKENVPMAALFPESHPDEEEAIDRRAHSASQYNFRNLAKQE